MLIVSYCTDRVVRDALVLWGMTANRQIALSSYSIWGESAQKWPVRCNCGGAISWLVSSWWQCTCHFVFLCMNIWLKENHPFTVLHLTRLPAVQLVSYFHSWRLHLMVTTMIHAKCKMHFAKFQTVYILQCLEQKHGHQFAVCSPQETTLWRLQE
jgi:hypothetical protein